MNERAITKVAGTTMLAGQVRAPLITLAEPVSFWGGYDAVTGTVTDRRHPDLGLCMTGAIVRMRAARGSSSGSSVLAEAIRLGTAPAGFVVLERDAILMLAALVAKDLYGKTCVIVQVDKAAYDALDGARSLSIDAAAQVAVIDID